MKKVLPYISAIIILSGLLVYVKWNIDDYNKGVEELARVGSEKNIEVNNIKVNLLLDQQHPEDAIDLLLKMVENDKENVLNKLKLAKLYCNSCKKDFTHCEDALWLLNTVIASDSANIHAIEMIKDLNNFLDVKIKK